MTTGQKVGIAIGALLLAGGVGFGIYAATRKKVEVPPANNGNQGGGTSSPAETNKTTDTLNKLLNAAALIKSYTVEKFPLRPGMMGPGVKRLQVGLRAMNQMAVSSDGIFGVKTATALKDTGYVKALINGVTEADLNNIVLGVRGNG